MKSKKILIFGGSGFIGKYLYTFLEEYNHSPIIVSRNKPKESYNWIYWDGVNSNDELNRQQGISAIINLAGKSVDCVKSPNNIDDILRSRVDSTKAIRKVINQWEYKPKAWIQMSTAHIYGDSETQICTENSQTGYGLAPYVGRAWERTFNEALPEDTRGVILRTAFVLGKNEGALQIFKRLAKFGLAGRFGNGKQGMSWIHESDLARFILFSLENKGVEGIFNLSSPHMPNNSQFMRAMRKAVSMPFGINHPSIIIHLISKFILNKDPELALYGRFVRSERLDKEGFQMQYTELNKALNHLLKQ